MTYNVFGGTLNLTRPSNNHLLNNRRLVSGRKVSKNVSYTERNEDQQLFGEV